MFNCRCRRSAHETKNSGKPGSSPLRSPRLPDLARVFYWRILMVTHEDIRIPKHIIRRVEITESGCWVYSGLKYPDGYSMVSYKDKTHQGHRLIFKLTVSDIPKGFVLDHLCRVRDCINPNHLEIVTPRENLRRGDTTTGWTRCQKCGGEFSVLRTQRRCLKCLAEYNESHREVNRLREAARRKRIKEAG